MPSMPPLPAPTMTGELLGWVLHLLSFNLSVYELQVVSMVKRNNAIYAMPLGFEWQLVSLSAKF